MTEPALLPWEAFDSSHPDHAEWVENTGQCLGSHDHTRWLADDRPTGEDEEVQLERVARALMPFLPMMHGNLRRDVAKEAAQAAIAAMEDQ